MGGKLAQELKAEIRHMSGEHNSSVGILSNAVNVKYFQALLPGQHMHALQHSTNGCSSA